MPSKLFMDRLKEIKDLKLNAEKTCILQVLVAIEENKQTYESMKESFKKCSYAKPK